MSKPADYVVVMTGGSWWFPHSLGPNFLEELLTAKPPVEIIAKADGGARRPIYHIYLLVGGLPDGDLDTEIARYLGTFPESPIEAHLFPIVSDSFDNAHAARVAKQILSKESHVDLIVYNSASVAKPPAKSVDIGGGLLLNNSLVFNLASPATLIRTLLPIMNSAVIVLVGSELYRKVGAEFSPPDLDKIASADSLDPEALFNASRFLQVHYLIWLARQHRETLKCRYIAPGWEQIPGGHNEECDKPEGAKRLWNACFGDISALQKGLLAFLKGRESAELPPVNNYSELWTEFFNLLEQSVAQK